MSNELTIIDQREVPFYDDELAAVRSAEGDVYVSLRHMCEALGIDPQGQRQRIQRHSVLERGLMVCKLHTIKGLRKSYVLRVDLMPLWLSGVRAKSVREEIRPKIERFQTEAGRVLWQAFENNELTTDSAFADILKQADSDAVEAYEMLQSMLKLARSHVILSTRVENHESRLQTIEAELGNSDRFLSQSQAMQISQAVKALGLELGKRSGRNEFQGVWGEVYRQFQVSSYLKLPAVKFDEVLDFLRQWWETVTGSETIPF